MATTVLTDVSIGIPMTRIAMADNTVAGTNPIIIPEKDKVVYPTKDKYILIALFVAV